MVDVAGLGALFGEEFMAFNEDLCSRKGPITLGPTLRSWHIA